MDRRITPRGGFIALASVTLVVSNVGLLASGTKPAGGAAGKGQEPSTNNALVFDDDTAGQPTRTPGDTNGDATGEGIVPASSSSAALRKDSDLPARLHAGSFEVVENGYRRVHRSETYSLSADELQDRLAQGKLDGIAGNTRTVATFTDHLPANFLTPDQVPAGVKVDSFGNPIVNSVPALPDWAQRDVDGLRNDLAAWLQHRDNLDLALAGQADDIATFPPRRNLETYLRDEENLLTDRYETEHVIGNYLGQAIVRSIFVDDIPGAAINQGLSDEVVNAIAAHLHHYEATKAHDAQRFGREYTPTAHPAQVTALLESRGHSMADVLSIAANGGGVGEQEGEGGIAGGIPLGCYTEFPFGVGATLLSGATILWDGGVSSYDDEYADIPIGFSYYFFPCSDDDLNTNVRVSTNGYVSFFEQGGGTLAGEEYSNTTLPSATDPDGMVAAWWDDLWVTNQGGTDSVGYKLEGAVGSRVLTVQWSSISRLGGDTSEFHWFQVKLFEDYTHVHTIYHTLWAPDSFDNATCGVENYSGSAAYCVWACTNTISAVPDTNMDFFYPQASNDSCSNAICLEADQALNGSTLGCSGTDITSCAFNDFPDVWYRYRATSSGNVTVSLCETLGNTDTTLAVFSSCGGSQLACDDDACSFAGPSSVTFAATSGTTYLIRVSGFNGRRGPFRIRVTGGAAGGEVCSNCWPLTATDSFTGSTNANTGCDDDSSCAFGDTIDEWFCWTAPFDGTAGVSTCSPTTNFDTTLAVYRGACPFPAAIACEDDTTLAACQLNGPYRKSRILWNVQGGTAYKVRLSGYSGAVGSYQLSISMWGCEADVSPDPGGNNVVDVNDLIAVILAWGPCSDCREDFAPDGGDGQVNADDLIAVILNWGNCP